MTTGHPQLVAAIASEIGRYGPISFARFMEMALYCPKIGYYERSTLRCPSPPDGYLGRNAAEADFDRSAEANGAGSDDDDPAGGLRGVFHESTSLY